MKAKIKEYFKKNNVKKVVYFHTDHFEPEDKNILIADSQYIERYISEIKKNIFFDSFDPFIKPYFEIKYNKNLNKLSMKDIENGIYGVGKDKVLFNINNKITKEISKIQYALIKNKIYPNIHIHHEHFTNSEFIDNFEIKKYILLESNSKLNRDRLRLYLSLTIEQMLRSYKLFNKTCSDQFIIDIKKLNWFFIHGKWALNAADRRVCTIDDEISLLQRKGFLGDFTFPAGRSHCDPHIEFPFSIIPKNIHRCYDYVKSEPAKVTDVSVNEDRFFIWNSRLKHPYGSLDIFSKKVEENLKNKEYLIYNWINKSPIINNTIYIKTYAHSLHESYINNNLVLFNYKLVKSAHNFLKESCEYSNVELNLKRARDVYKEVIL